MVVPKQRLLFIAPILWLAGCAAPGALESPAARSPAHGDALVESRTDKQIRRDVWAERFLAARERCESEGRRIVIMATGRPDRDGIPASGDRYFCQ